MVEKLITLGKKNTNATRVKAEGYLHQPQNHISKVFGELRTRYADRPGGYTRLLLSEPLKDDQAQSAILSLIDGPKDMRFNITARALLRQQTENLPMNEITATNIRKVTRFRKKGVEDLAKEVEHLKITKAEREEEEKKLFEKDGTRVKYTAEVPRSDPRWREKRGPGRLVRRRIGPNDNEDV